MIVKFKQQSYLFYITSIKIRLFPGTYIRVICSLMFHET
jgi:hypothetical protein